MPSLRSRWESANFEVRVILISGLLTLIAAILTAVTSTTGVLLANNANQANYFREQQQLAFKDFSTQYFKLRSQIAMANPPLLDQRRASSADVEKFDQTAQQAISAVGAIEFIARPDVREAGIQVKDKMLERIEQARADANDRKKVTRDEYERLRQETESSYNVFLTRARDQLGSPD